MRRTLVRGASAQTLERVLGFGPLSLDTEIALTRALLYSYDLVELSDDELGPIFQFPGEDMIYAFDEDECGARSVPTSELCYGGAAGSFPEESAPDDAEDYAAHSAYARFSLADSWKLGRHLVRAEETGMMRMDLMLVAVSMAATGTAEEEARRYREVLDDDVFGRIFGDRSYVLAIAFDPGDDRIVRHERDLFGGIDIELVDPASKITVLPEIPVPEHWDLKAQARARIPGPQVLVHRNPVWRRS